jgi:phage tail sheath protein FI
MPVTVSYPGVYIEEIPSGVRTITGVATSIAAFVGRARSGPVNDPVVINGFGDFERRFGGLGIDYPMSYAVRDFFLNGGGQAIIVRLYKKAGESDGAAKLEIGTAVKLKTVSPGEWGKWLRASAEPVKDKETVKRLGIKETDALFNLTVRDTRPGGLTEQFRNLTFVESSRRVDKVLVAESQLVLWNGVELPKELNIGDVKISDKVTTLQTDENGTYLKAKTALWDARLANKKPEELKPLQEAVDVALKAIEDEIDKAGAADSADLTATDYVGSEADKTGFYALAKTDLFNLLCIPPNSRDGDTLPAVFQAAMAFCVRRRAMLIVDPPMAWGKKAESAAADALKGLDDLGLTGTDARNAALYFPRVVQPDPLSEGRLDTFVPCGAVAGVMARTDVQRGVWKAPAGLDAALNGVQALQVNLNDLENGQLNPLGINCLRLFPGGAGRVVWGARTLRGSDQLADEYKYIPVRRLALFIEESLFRGTKWVVFEPNDEPLWSQIRTNVGAFMNNLFRQGAFQGSSPREAYLVKCDKETTTQNDINLGIVNIVVGFAPLKPAEFVIIKIQQLAGQIET